MKRFFKKRLTRSIFYAIVILLALLLGGISHYFYTISHFEHNRSDVNEAQRYQSNRLFLSPMTDNQLVQSVLDAVREPERIRSIYYSIPLYQLNGLTFEEFSQYINVLVKVSNQPFDTFSSLTTSAKNQIIQQIDQQNKSLKSVLENSRFFWLEHSSSKTNQKIPLMIQKNIQGEYYFSRIWIRRCLKLYDYAQFYIQALKNNDEVAVSHLIYSDSDSLLVRTKKARLILDSYRHYHVDFDKDLSIIGLSMDQIVLRVDLAKVEQPDIHEPQRLTRDMSICYDGEQFTIKDAGTLEVNQIAFEFMKRIDPKTKISLGEHVDQATIFHLFGQPKSISVHDLPDWLSYEGRAQIINLYYPEISFQIIGITGEENTFEGIIRSVVLYRPSVSTVDGIYPSMTLEQLLLKYPFFDHMDYTYRRDESELYVGIKNGSVYDVRLTDRRFDQRKNPLNRHKMSPSQ